MGGASSRLKNSKHKDKVKQFMNLFNKKSLSSSLNEQDPTKWIKGNISPNIKLRINDCKHMPIQNSDSMTEFMKYYQKFTNSLEFKSFKDVKFLDQVFEVVDFTCILNSKYEVNGTIWFCTKTGEIYEINLQQKITGGLTSFDVIKMQTKIQWDTPQFRGKYLPKKQASVKPIPDIARQIQQEKKLQHLAGTYYQQVKEGTFGGTYWR